MNDNSVRIIHVKFHSNPTRTDGAKSFSLMKCTFRNLALHVFWLFFTKYLLKTVIVWIILYKNEHYLEGSHVVVFVHEMLLELGFAYGGTSECARPRISHTTFATSHADAVLP